MTRREARIALRATSFGQDLDKGIENKTALLFIIILVDIARVGVA